MANVSKSKGTIAILTGGGDVPGLNPAIRAITIRALREGYKVLGLRRGWAGIMELKRDKKANNKENVIELTEEIVNRAGRTGGTFLHTSRTNPSNVPKNDVPDFLKDQIMGDEPQDYTEHVLSVLETLKIDALIPIGGDDTLSYALRLHEEGVKTVGIPKTMDNDVRGTDYCIGFSTAVTRSVNIIHNVRTSTGSHERIAVIELFGRYSGETSLVAAYLSGVDRAVISEVPFDPVKLAEFLVKDKKANPSNYAMMTISEGATIIGGDMVMSGKQDAFGHKKLGGIGAVTGDIIKELTGEDVQF